ncbi:ATP-binding protein [Phenylobacterium sp.]|uniref:sensor histidine kinase n=1 Tax=Phenylobacterium sp. TaxID=1871053 RepID=UPI00289CAB39|nr:ATP-binding protein [Phenylobacterium sp.]
MSRVPQDVEQTRPAGARLVGHEGGAYLAAFLLVLIVAVGVDLALMGEYRLERFSAALLAGVLVIATALGLGYGLAAGGAALAALHFLAQTPLLPQGWLSQDGLLFGLLCAAVVSAGLYADFARRRESATRALLAAGGRLSAHVSDTALGQFMRSAGGERSGRSDALENTGRTAACVLIIAAGWALAHVVGGGFGPGAALILLIGAVLVAGGALGASLGLAGGVLAVLASMAFPAAAQAQFAAAPPIVAFDLLMFAGFGWGVGRLADRLQHERRAIDSLTSASREFSAGADEASVRKILLESLVKVTGGGAVELVDEVGGASLASPGRTVAGRWRERTLSSDGRVVGTVRWLPGAGDGRKDGDDVAVSVIDLGASAIVRARLGVEKAEMEFRARTEQLRTILLDAVSHHFRSPLAGILGSATSILNLPEQHDREARRELLLIIKEQANRLNRYVENFLSVARLESGAIDVNLTEVALEPLLYDVWETFGEAGGARRFLHAPVGEAAVLADRSLLGQVFGNILENAIKFSGEGSMVDIRCRREGAQMVIDFTDQGCGVAPGNEDRIFDRFFRAQATQAPGLGLGLYITRSLVEMLSGTVTARNRTDGESGLVISVSLPATGAA